MTRDRVSLISYLFRAYRQAPDEFQFELYDRELGDVPLPLLEAAVRYAIRTRPSFVPTVGELLEDVGAIQQANPAARQPFEACPECVNGWAAAEPAGEMQQLAGYDSNRKAILRPMREQPAVTRCACWLAWRRSQGLPSPAPVTSLQVDVDKAIGGANDWTTPREITGNPKIARFKTRVERRRS